MEEKIVKFVRVSNETLFNEKLIDSTISPDAIVFIELELKIWSNGVFYDKSSSEVFISNGVEPSNLDITIWIDESENSEVPNFLVKSYADLLYLPLGDYITSDELTARNYSIISVVNNVLANNWENDNTYSDFPYVCNISVNTLSIYLGEVIFDLELSLSGNYAPVCETVDGGIKIWSKVTDAITIPTIKIIKYGNN